MTTNVAIKGFIKSLRYKFFLIIEIFKVLFQNKYSQKVSSRLLIVYDLSFQPFSIGDILMYHEASYILTKEHDIDKIDFVFLYDSQNIKSSDSNFDRESKDATLYNLINLIPVATLNNYLGSFMIFNSDAQLIKYLNDNRDTYILWPSIDKIMRGTYNYHEIFNKLIAGSLDKYGDIPRFSTPPFLKNWANDFINKVSKNNIPVSVNIRNNNHHGNHRNANIEVWLNLFEYCLGKYPVKFLLICSRSEIDIRFYNYSNVIVVKDFGTRIDHDLSLISESAFHMGSDSGPAAYAYFTNKPFLVVNTDMVVSKIKYATTDGKYVYVKHLLANQHVSCFEETTEFLIEEFMRMWETVDKNIWDDRQLNSVKIKDDFNWLY